MRGPLRTDTGELAIISRRDAADSGRTFFYSGKPCKYGHLDVRYVTTGGCRACLRGNFRPKMNPWTHKLIPFSNPNLWTLQGFSKAQRVALRVYLQHCIFEFIRKNIEQEPLAYRAEVEAAMEEIEQRGQYATADDPRNTD